jgi:ABC-2 type transport system permease protein
VIGQLRSDAAVARATARSHLLRWASNPIMLVRAPLGPILVLVGFALVYSISDQHTAGGQDAMGFLVVGMLANLAWSATVWGAGNALQSEIYDGTVNAVLIAPARTAAVVLGHGIGGIVWGFPGLIACILIGFPFGAHYDIGHPIAAVLCLVLLYAATLCIGLGFCGLFILSRQSNAMSNFLQAPIYLLAGFYAPRSALPGWLQDISAAIPLAHAVDALRRTTLSGGSLTDVWRPVAATVCTSLCFLLMAVWSLSTVDNAVRRSGTLDLQ